MVLKEFMLRQLTERREFNAAVATALQEQIDRRFAELKGLLESTHMQAELRTQAALSAQGQAVAKAEAATEKRFDSVNEFRASLADQTARLLPRAEADAKFASTGEQVSGINSNVAKVELALRDVSAAAVRREDLRAMGESIEKLRESSAAAIGRSSGAAQIISVGMGVMAILVSLTGVYFASHSSSGAAASDTINQRISDLVDRQSQMAQRLNALVRPLTIQPETSR